MADLPSGGGKRRVRGAFRAVVQGCIWSAAAPLPADAPHRAARALLRDTDLPIIEVAFQTGWSSLGTFGRIFRDITGESPTDLREREQAAEHKLEDVPHCFVKAAHRPDLKIAVSEKRRLDGGDTRAGPKEKEVP